MVYLVTVNPSVCALSPLVRGERLSITNLKLWEMPGKQLIFML